MLQPAKTKYRKLHKGELSGISVRGSRLAFGQYGLKSIGRGIVTSRQLEASRQAMARSIKRGGKIWIRVFPDKPITRKAAETPMGSGKGNVEFYAAVVLPGRILFELGGVEEVVAKEALRLASYKLPVKTKFISH